MNDLASLFFSVPANTIGMLLSNGDASAQSGGGGGGSDGGGGVEEGFTLCGPCCATLTHHPRMHVCVCVCLCACVCA